ANRLGSNSLTECLVFGAAAGRAAAEYAIKQPAPSYGNPVSMLASQEESRIYDKVLKHEQGERISTLRVEMQKSMERYVGIYRDENSLIQACKIISDLKKRAENITVEGKDRVFNIDLVSALVLGFLTQAAAAYSSSVA